MSGVLFKRRAGEQAFGKDLTKELCSCYSKGAQITLAPHQKHLKYTKKHIQKANSPKEHSTKESQSFGQTFRQQPLLAQSLTKNPLPSKSVRTRRAP